MKKKTFFEPLDMYGGFFLFCVFMPCFYLFLVVCTNSPDDAVFVDLYFVIMAVVTEVVFYRLGGSRQDCIIVTEDGVIWRCLFRRTRRLSYADCRYIGVETFNKEARRAIIRGDECAAIYLSIDPFPEELKGRINHLRCSDRIIKFRYTDALAEAILEVAPKEKAFLLRGFYNQMQNADRQREQHRKQRKKRKR